MADQTMTLSRPWWSYARIGLRWLIGLILLIGCGLGWIVREAHVQREAVAAIRSAGGEVWYDLQWKDGGTSYDGPSLWLKWLIGCLGVDYFGHVVSVHMHEPASDQLLVHIGRLGYLKILYIRLPLPARRSRRHWRPSSGEPAVTDEGLVHLEGLVRLETLVLRGTAITDAGLVHLKRLTRLKTLDLSETAITGSGLPFLKNLGRLERLDLDDTGLDDAGMAQVRSLVTLRNLHLGNKTKVTRVGLDHLRGLANLRSLNVGYDESSQPLHEQAGQALPGVDIYFD